MQDRSAAPSSSTDSASEVRTINVGPLIFDVALCAVLAFLFCVIPPIAIQPYRRGFFCDDDTIRYPAKNDTISIAVLAVIVIVLVTLTWINAVTVMKMAVQPCFLQLGIGLMLSTLQIGLVEWFRIRKRPSGDNAVYRIRDRDVHRLLVQFCAFAAHCALCTLVTVIISQATKYAVGRLRPNFIDVCKPNLNLTNCEMSRDYITDYVCTGEDKARILESRLSFFSGHSTIAMCVAVYLVLYLQARLPRRTYGVSLLPVLQTILIIGALLVGFSRVDDNMHHWSDVLVGFLVGAIAGVVSAVYFAQLFKRRNAIYRNEEQLPLIDADMGDVEKNLRSATMLSTMTPNGNGSIMATTIPAQSAGL